MKKYACSNCDKPLEKMGDAKIFAGVLVCVACHKIVQTHYDRARKTLDTILELYKDVLRASLVRKQAHLPTLPKEPTMPLATVMNMLKVVDENAKKRHQDS
jgi:hypothetical protein